MSFTTAGSIVNECAIELGLLTSSVADPYSSMDSNLVMLRQLLKSAGRELARTGSWSHLRLTHTFSTVAGTTLYTAPTGFLRLVDQTAWNRTTQVPLGGPVSPQGWQLFKAQAAGGVVDLYFRLRGAVVEVHPTPTTAQEVAFEYMTGQWVAADSGLVPASDAPTATGNYCLFDSHLLTRKVLLAFLRRRGFDSTAAQQDYDAAYEAVTSGDSAAPVLSLIGGTLRLGRLLDCANVPETQVGE